jgi:hypothetical protein
MRHFWFALVVAAALTVSFPFAARAMGLDVEVKAGAGLALGSTTNPNQTGTIGLAGLGGLDLDLFLFNAGGFDVGIAAGAEFSYMLTHGALSINAGVLGNTTLNSDATVYYINVPVALVARVPLNDSLFLALRAGGYGGYFLSGSANNTYNPEIPLAGLTNGTVTLNSNTTNQWEWGLHFTGGVDIKLSGNLFLSPSIVFDLGLTNTTATSGYQYKDTFWSLTGMVGLKYVIL